MDNRRVESVETRKFKDAILAEIFNAYKESGAVYQKTTDPETRRTVLDMKRCFDLAIHHLSPPDVFAGKLWEELNTPFSSPDAAPKHHRPDEAGLRPSLEG